jgi:hypothetical protein
VDNSIKLKELQIVNGVFKKRDKGLRFYFILFFSKEFCLGEVGGEDGIIPPLSKGGLFCKGLG